MAATAPTPAAEAEEAEGVSADMQRAIAAAVQKAVKPPPAPVAAFEDVPLEPAPAAAAAKLSTPATAPMFERTPQCNVPGITSPLWGPGWLADPLRLTFEFDDVAAVADPLPPSVRTGTAAGEKVVLAPVLRSHGKLSGRLEVALADVGVGYVPHNGVSLVLTSTLESLKPSASNSGTQLLPAGKEYPLRSTSLALLEPGTLRTEQRLAFSLDLDAIAPPETFHGSRFWIRHELSAVVSRPWYSPPLALRARRTRSPAALGPPPSRHPSESLTESPSRARALPLPTRAFRPPSLRPSTRPLEPALRAVPGTPSPSRRSAASCCAATRTAPPHRCPHRAPRRRRRRGGPG